MPKRILGIGFLFFSVAFSWANGIFKEPDRLPNDAYARTIEQAFKNGYINGHIGTYAQQSSHKDPTFIDLNFSISYETLRWKGYKIGVEGWLNAKVFEVYPHDFAHNKDIFILPKIYADFYNSYERFGIRVGRYGINEEWITHNTEGFSVDYDGLQYTSLHFSWAFRNAYVENYYSCGFGGCDNFGDRVARKYRVIGALYLRGSFDIPQFPVKLTPYFYTAPGIFFTTALKASMDLPVPYDIFVKSNVHLISYIQDKGYYGPNAGAGFAFLMDGSVYWNGLEGGVGFSATDSHGASMIDAFGQQTPFERPVGMFWGGATTIYGFVKYHMNYLDLSAGIRNTFINSKNVFNWELKASGTPIYNFKGLQLGLSVIGMNNSSEAIDYFGGKNYILVRGFVQYKF